jgi:hypothetical protein
MLDLAGHRRVVLRGRDQQRIGAVDRVAQPLHLGRRGVRVAVLVVGRKCLEPVIELELDVGWGEFGSRREQRRVIRRRPQAA